MPIFKVYAELYLVASPSFLPHPSLCNRDIDTIPIPQGKLNFPSPT